MKSNQCRMKESEFENTDTYWSYFSNLSSSSSASLSSLRSFITTTCKAGPTETLPSPRVAPTVSSNHGQWSSWHEHILRSVNAMYPIQQQKSYLLGCNPFDKYIVFVSLPPVPVVEQNRIWGQSEQSSTGATISSLCKTDHVWLQQQLIKWSKRNQNVEWKISWTLT